MADYDTMQQMKNPYRKVVRFLEYILSALIIIGTIYFAYSGYFHFMESDWTKIETFYEFISYMLLVTVGLELTRLMISHSIESVLELMILIVARKMLVPEAHAIDLFINVLAITVLVLINYLYDKWPLKRLEDLSS